jgi:hypothetical protein
MKIFESVSDYNSQRVRLWSLQMSLSTERFIMPGWVFTTFYMKEASHYPYTILLPSVYLGIGFPSESETSVG